MSNYPPLQTPIAGNLSVTREWLLYFRNLVSGSGAAPADATYVLTSASATLPNGRVATNSTSVTVNTATAGQISWERAALTGDVTASANANATTLSNTGVTANTYGDATHVGQFTVDAKGRLTAATNVAITGTVLKTTKTILDADIKKLPGTPVLVLAGPASGFRNKLIGGSIRAHIVTGYAGLDATYCALVASALGSGDWVTTAIADDVSTSPAITHLTDFITVNATDSIVDLIPYQEVASGVLPFTGYVNVYPEDVSVWDAANWSAIIDNNGSTSDLTGGNAANYLLITLYYVVESLT